MVLPAAIVPPQGRRLALEPLCELRGRFDRVAAAQRQQIIVAGDEQLGRPRGERLEDVQVVQIAHFDLLHRGLDCVGPEVELLKEAPDLIVVPLQDFADRSLAGKPVPGGRKSSRSLPRPCS